MTLNKKQQTNLIKGIESFLPNLESEEISYDIIVELLTDSSFIRLLADIISFNKDGV